MSDSHDPNELSLLRAGMIGAALTRVDPHIRAWLPELKLRAQVEADIDRALARRSDRAVAARSANACPVAGASVDDYLGQLLEIAGHRVLISPRFLGLDTGRAFVELDAADFTADDEDALADVLAGCLTAYACFSPWSLRVSLGSHQAPRLPAGASIRPDLRILAGPIAALAARPKPPSFDRMTLVRCGDTSFHPRYREAYDEVHADRPALADGLYISGAEALAPVVAEGHFYEAWIDGEWAGVVAAARSPFYGVPSFVVHEELLIAKFRGRGFGVVLQRQLIEALNSDSTVDAQAILFGTIHPLNLPSIATAKRIGRIDVGGYFFVIPGSADAQA